MKAEPLAYVLDSFALLAHFGAEPGAKRVGSLMALALSEQARTYLSMINFGEVLYITERAMGLTAARTLIGVVDQLPIVIVEADRNLTFAAAHVKAHYPISYADAFAVALAQAKGARLLTGDPEFHSVEELVTVEWLPPGIKK